jgi:ABC-type glycerol-3-phosphate transport system substrate-binding protein
MSSPECLGALTQLRELQDSVGLTVIDKPIHWKVIEQLSGNGPAAVMTVPSLAGIYYSFIRNPGDLQMGAFPSQAAKKTNLLGNAMVWVLTRPDDREAAMAFLRWAVRPDKWAEQWQMWEKLGKKFTVPPFVTDKDLRKQLESSSPE